MAELISIEERCGEMMNPLKIKRLERTVDIGDWDEFACEKIDNLSMRRKRKIKTAELGKDEVPIGYTDPDYEEDLVTLTPKGRFAILIASNLAGSGKSVLGMNLVEHIKELKKYHFVIFDAKPEFMFRNQQQLDTVLRNKVLKIRRDIPYAKPKGLNMMSVAPKFSFDDREAEERFDGESIRYELNEMSLGDIITLFGLSVESRDGNRLNKLNMAVYGLTDEEDFNEALEDGTIDEHELITTSELHDIFRKGHIVDSTLKNNLMTMRKDKVIGRSTGFNIVNALNQNKIIHYMTSTASDDSHLNRIRAYISVEMKRDQRARRNYITPGLSSGADVLKKPIVYYFSEFQTVMPKAPFMPSTKSEIISMYDKQRYLGIGLIADTADILSIDKLAIKQSDYIMAFKMSGSGLRHLAKERGLSYEQEQQIANLYFDKSNPPNECALIPTTIDPSSMLETFFPLPPMSNIQQE